MQRGSVWSQYRGETKQIVAKQIVGKHNTDGCSLVSIHVVSLSTHVFVDCWLRVVNSADLAKEYQLQRSRESDSQQTGG